MRDRLIELMKDFSGDIPYYELADHLLEGGVIVPPVAVSGTLVLRIDGELVTLKNSLASGGSVTFDDDLREIVEQGEWSVDLPEKYKHLKDEITDIVNENVEYGCCGGCV